MSSAADDWRALFEEFQKFSQKIGRVKTQKVSSVALRDQARALAHQYFRQARQYLDHIEERNDLDDMFRVILAMSENSNRTSSYVRALKKLRPLFPQVAGNIEVGNEQKLVEVDAVITAEDTRIIETLGGIVPTAALSYQQALIDLADLGRLSYRGPASELREALRETLDHLAPDDEVEKMPGFKHEEGRDKPTMKQKVRFIRNARGRSKSSGEAPEGATNIIDELVGSFARTVYNVSSVATHVAGERKQVSQVKRYVVVVLHEILEI